MAPPEGMCCVMACAVLTDRDRWRTACAAGSGRARARSKPPVVSASMSRRYDRFATRFATLAGDPSGRRLSYGGGFGFAAIVIVRMMSPGMVDSGAAVAGFCAPAKWRGGLNSLRNRGGG